MTVVGNGLTGRAFETVRPSICKVGTTSLREVEIGVMPQPHHSDPLGAARVPAHA